MDISNVIRNTYRLIFRRQHDRDDCPAGFFLLILGE